MRNFSVSFALLFFLAGCSTGSYLISSNPSGTNVFFVDPTTQKRFFMGATPLNYSKAALPMESAFLISLEKDGYLTQEIPVAPTDESKTMINVNMRGDPAGSTTANRELNKLATGLFRAQELIYKKQYQAAVVELDKILKEKPDIVQAHVMKGTAYYLLNELPSATEAWKRAMKLDPGNEELTKFLAEKNINLK